VSVLAGFRAAVSVVIPAFNAEEFIGNALESVLAGTCLPAEIIVVDDGSSDRTVEIARSYGVRTIVQTSNGGPSAARNAGVAATRQPWIAFLDADDVWHTEKLALQWAAIQHWPAAGVCITDYDVVGTDGAVRLQCETLADPGYRTMTPSARSGSAALFERSAFCLGLVRSMFVRQSSALVRRDVFFACGGYNGRYRIGEDYDFFLRLSGHAPAISIERALVKYLRHDASLSADPLAEIAAIDAIWDHISADPQRYPNEALGAIRRRRVATVRGGALLALRLGRIREARAFVFKALQFGRSPTTVSLYGLWLCAETPVGRRVHHFVRKAWRLRHGRAHAKAVKGAV
jgi:glycosyltransferase involved in cell wall biosynthesis